MNRTEKTHVPVVALTHPGRRGKNNEDRFGVFAFRLKDHNVPVLLAVLADGIGGHRAGEVAAEMAVEMIARHAAASDGQNPPQILEEAVEAASEAIFSRAQANPDQNGMGSTCAVAWISGSRLFTATVGDSRIYLMRGGHVQQLSIDHTWIQEAIERGLLKPDEAEGHPNSHVIRRYLGSPTPPQVDFRLRLTEEQGNIQALQNQGLLLQADDLLLLCSDGLSDLVSGDEMRAAFERADLGTAAESLIDLANERGGHDNITLIAARVTPEALAAVPSPVATTAAAASAVPAAASIPARPAAARQARKRMHPLLAGCLGAIIFSLVLASLAFGYLYFSGSLSGPDPTATATPPLTLEAPGALPTLSSPTPGPAQRRTPLRAATPTRTARPANAPTITAWPTSTP